MQKKAAHELGHAEFALDNKLLYEIYRFMLKLGTVDHGGANPEGFHVKSRENTDRIVHPRHF